MVVCTGIVYTKYELLTLLTEKENSLVKEFDYKPVISQQI
jgi:hypothetical protein